MSRDGFTRMMRTSRLIVILGLILTISSAITFTTKAQGSHSVTFWERGVGLDYTGTVATIGGKDCYVANLDTCYTVSTDTGVSFNYQSPLVVNASKQYIWIYTTSDTTPPITTQQGTVPADTDGNVYGFYQAQYSVTFSTNPMGAGTTTPSGSNIWIGEGSIQIVATPSQGHSFSSWTSTGPITIANQGSATTSATINGPGTITANFAEKSIQTYMIYPYAKGHGSINPPLPVRVAHGDDKIFTFTPDDGYGVSAITVDDKPVPVSSSYAFTNVKANHIINVTFAADAPQTIAVKIDSSPSGQGFVSVDGIPTATPSIFSWSPGSTHSLAASSMLVSVEGIRYVFSSWSDGGNQSHTYTVSSSPANVTAGYGAQYQLTMKTNSGTVTPTDGSWYDAGSKVTVQAKAPNAVNGESYVFGGWKGSLGGYSGASNPSGEITMNGPVTEEATWQHTYRLTVSSPYGTTGGSGWYEVGQVVQASIDKTTEPGASNVQYIFAGWGGDASGTGSTSNNIVMDAPRSATANWNTQYQIVFSQSGLDKTAVWGAVDGVVLTVDGATLGVGNLPYVTGWVNSGAVVQYTYSDTMTSSMGEVLKLGALSGSPSPLTVVGPTNISGSYSFQGIVPQWYIAIIAFLVLVSTIVIVYLRRRNGPTKKTTS